jgi:hypothetical protein
VDQPPHFWLWIRAIVLLSARAQSSNELSPRYESHRLVGNCVDLRAEFDDPSWPEPWRNHQSVGLPEGRLFNHFWTCDCLGLWNP